MPRYVLGCKSRVISPVLFRIEIDRLFKSSILGCNLFLLFFEDKCTRRLQLSARVLYPFNIAIFHRYCSRLALRLYIIFDFLFLWLFVLFYIICRFMASRRFYLQIKCLLRFYLFDSIPTLLRRKDTSLLVFL